MHRVGWVLIALGFLLQILIPSGILKLRGAPVLGIPLPILGVLGASFVVLVGILFVYDGWYRQRIERLDRR